MRQGYYIQFDPVNETNFTNSKSLTTQKKNSRSGWGERGKLEEHIIIMIKRFFKHALFKRINHQLTGENEGSMLSIHLISVSNIVNIMI